MEPNRVGRILGVGARVAAGKIRERSAQAAASAARPTPASPSVPAPSAPASQAPPRPDPAAVLARNGRRAGRGVGRAGAAFIKPFAHATGILWFQIAGVFFGLFALFFLSHAWQSFHQDGLHDRHMDIYLAIGLLFTWFTATSFWRARKKQQ